MGILITIGLWAWRVIKVAMHFARNGIAYLVGAIAAVWSVFGLLAGFVKDLLDGLIPIMDAAAEAVTDWVGTFASNNQWFVYCADCLALDVLYSLFVDVLALFGSILAFIGGAVVVCVVGLLLPYLAYRVVQRVVNGLWGR